MTLQLLQQSLFNDAPALLMQPRLVDTLTPHHLMTLKTLQEMTDWPNRYIRRWTVRRLPLCILH